MKLKLAKTFNKNHGEEKYADLADQTAWHRQRKGKPKMKVSGAFLKQTGRIRARRMGKKQ